MKVMCIDNSIRPNSYMPHLAKLLEEGQVYTVLIDYGDAYELVELKHPCGGLWIADRFVPLSDIDETELVKEREQVLINQ